MRPDNEKQFTRFTHESSYGVKTIIEYSSEDLNADDYLQAMVTMMTSATFTPRTIYETMIDFAKDALSALGPEED